MLAAIKHCFMLWNVKNDLLPACDFQISLTINCEFSTCCFIFGIQSPLIGGHFHRKFGGLWVKGHGSMNVRKSIFCFPFNILTPVCARPWLFGPHDKLPCVLIRGDFYSEQRKNPKMKLLIIWRGRNSQIMTMSKFRFYEQMQFNALN